MASRAATTCSPSTWRWSLPGYEMANWEKGYGDFGIAPDMATLRRSMARPHGAGARRRRRARRQPGRRLPASDPDRAIRACHRDGLHPVRRVGARVLPLQGELLGGLGEGVSEPHPDDPLHPRLPHPRHHDGRGLSGADSPRHAGRRNPVEFSKGEAWYGQHEVNFRYADAVTSADRHTIYKNGVKEIAFLNDISASFMAKPSEKDIGSSCHLHHSLVGDDGKSLFVDDDGEETDTFRHFLGGLRDHIRAALFIASVNSYKRYAAESWAPTSVSWGRDNRTCGFRIVGHGQSRRVECRIPGADANPYLAFAAMLAAGLDGIENGTDPGPELKGNAYEAAEAEPFLGSGRRRSLGFERFCRNRSARRSRSTTELRALRAAGVRPGGDGLREAPDVRAG